MQKYFKLIYIRLTASQWKITSSAFSNISQAIILFSLAALFVPEVVNLTGNFSRNLSFIYLFCGLFLLAIAVTISERGK